MIFLHHYPTSPWAEVIRLAFGVKGLEWRSVETPVINPKPALARLTGGYTRVPVLSRDADVYCDTRAIVAALEAEPGPSLFPQPGHAELAERAQGPVFFAAVGAALGDLPAAGMEAFWEDRRTRFGMEPAQLRAMAPGLADAFGTHLDGLEERLDGPYLLGDAPGHGDLAQYQLLWFQGARGQAGLARWLDGRPKLADWFGRVGAIGHGKRVESDAAEAEAAAKANEPRALAGGVDGGFSAGQVVTVAQDGCRDAPVRGRLVAMDTTAVVVAHETPETGLVHVHFPRAGQTVIAA